MRTLDGCIPRLTRVYATRARVFALMLTRMQVVFGTMVGWNVFDQFYDRLQTMDLIEGPLQLCPPPHPSHSLRFKLG